MDAVSALLAGHRARDAFVLRGSMRAPWSVRIADRSAVAVVVQLRGSQCIVASTTETLQPGDLAVIKGAIPYQLADRAGTAPVMVVEPGQVCRPLDTGADVDPYELDPTSRTWGNDPDGECVFIAGIYELPGQISGHLLDAVPDLLVLPSAQLPAVSLLAEELDRDLPGQDAVLNRLVDLVLISALRSWLMSAGAAAPAWWRARTDPVVWPVLRLMQEQPQQAWTVGSLAETAHVSRATLARRFTQLLGQPPLGYLTDWRLTLAADRLRDTRQSVEQIAVEVGYANPFAFSTAFKRRYGVPPRQYRLAAAG